MKITFIIYSLSSGGAERAVTGLANSWCQEHKISIITLVKTVPFYEINTKVKLSHCFEETKTKTNVFQSLKNGFIRIHRLYSTLKAERPDVVISFMHTSNIYAIWASKLLNIPCIISERANHDVYRLPKTHEVLRNLSYPHSAALIVQTEGNRTYYQEILPSVKKFIIPNAIAPSLKSKRVPNEKREKIILNVGSFKNGKAQDLLIRAFANINNTDWRLVFLGKGPNLNKYKELAVHLGIANKIGFKGAQKDVARYYNKAGLFVFTSEHEGFPNALLEALFFGIPSISTNCPHGPSDMIQDGENGFLVPVGDENALAYKMQMLMESEKLQEKFTETALESTKKYEMEPIAEEWMRVIKSVTV